MSDDQPLSQEDIDAALAGLSDGDDESAKPETDAPAPESDGSAANAPAADESLNQTDIDAALAGLSDGGDESTEPDGSTANASTAEAANAADEAAPAAPAEAEPDAGGAVGQDDIDALLSEMENSTDPEASSADASPSAGDPPPTDSPTDAAASAQLDSAGRPFDEAAAEMAAAIAKEVPATVPSEPAPPPPGAEPLSLPDLGAGSAPDDPFKPIELLKDVGLQVKIELGRSRMLVEDVVRLGEGSVVELDKLAGDPVDVYVNDRLVARGEVLVLNDNFCVRVNEIVTDLWKEFQTA